MPLIQQILLLIRTLAEDEPPQHQRNAHGRKRSDSKRRQAANLVITFRELFATGGLNFLVDDDIATKTMNRNIRQRRDTIQGTIDPEFRKQCVVDLPEEVGFTKPVNSTTIGTITGSREIALPLYIASNPENAPSREIEVFRGGKSKRRKPVTVPLSSEDENKTVAALRKVLKWSPTKQNLATFTVAVSKEEKHKAVAVVQNAVNRVKEEQQQKKKKRKMLKLTFC